MRGLKRALRANGGVFEAEETAFWCVKAAFEQSQRSVGRKKQKTPSGELGEKCVCEKVFINEQLI